MACGLETLVEATLVTAAWPAGKRLRESRRVAVDPRGRWPADSPMPHRVWPPGLLGGLPAARGGRNARHRGGRVVEGVEAFLLPRPGCRSRRGRPRDRSQGDLENGFEGPDGGGWACRAQRQGVQDDRTTSRSTSQSTRPRKTIQATRPRTESQDEAQQNEQRQHNEQDIATTTRPRTNDGITIRLGIRILGVAMTAHAKVTTMAHSASGMGQVWYRVTGSTGVATGRSPTGSATATSTRVGCGSSAAGATAQLTGFRPGELVGGEWDLVLIERAFSGEYLTHGVKTRRSQFARVPAAPVHQAITEALELAGLDAAAVFTSRDAAAWWRALTRAANGARSVSFLTASGAVRAAARAGATVDADRLHELLGAVVRERVTGPVPVRGRKTDAATQLDLRIWSSSRCRMWSWVLASGGRPVTPRGSMRSRATRGTS